MYTVNQSIKSVIKKEKENSKSQGFYPGSPNKTGYVQSVTYSKDSLKMIKLIKFTTLAHNKNTLLPAANHY